MVLIYLAVSRSNTGNTDLLSDSVREFSKRQKCQNNIMIFAADLAASKTNLSRPEVDQIAPNIIQAAFSEAVVENIKMFHVGMKIHLSPDH